MKLLTIVRHAKSSWDNFEISDHDRTIKPIGEQKTKKIITYLNNYGLKVDLLIFSTAKRAQQTAILVADGIGYDQSSIIYKKSIYHAFKDDIYDELYGINNEVESVLLVGHNPTLTDFVNDYVTPNIDNLPTSGTVCLEFKTNKWEDIIEAKPKVKFVIYLKMLK